MGFLDFLSQKKGPAAHKLKWEIPEARITAPVDEVEKTVAAIKKLNAKFVSGGEFHDTVHAKPYGPGVFAYFIVRTARKSEAETVVFDGYMLREDDALGLELQSRYGFSEDLEKIGYAPVFERDVTEWRFAYAGLRVNVFKIEGFGNFIEVALPATKIEKTRELNQATADKFLEKTGIDKKNAIPTDAITLQLTVMQEAAEKEKR